MLVPRPKGAVVVIELVVELIDKVIFVEPAGGLGDIVVNDPTSRVGPWEERYGGSRDATDTVAWDLVVCKGTTRQTAAGERCGSRRVVDRHARAGEISLIKRADGNRSRRE